MASSINGETKPAVLITGATGNIGSAAFDFFTEKDYFVTGLARRGNDKVQSLDLGRSWNSTELWCNSQIGVKYDLVIVAHGVQKPCTLETMTEDNWSSIVYGNLSSAIGLTQALVKCNKLENNGMIVYCSSIQANTPRSGRGLYAACKAGLEAFSKVVAVELSPRGIRSVTLRLGQLTQTMNGVKFSEEERNKLEGRTLLSWVEPIDIVNFIYDIYLRQKSLTGCTIDLDSGHSVNVW